MGALRVNGGAMPNMAVSAVDADAELQRRLEYLARRG